MGQSSDTISGGSGRFDRLRPPVEVDPSLVEVRRGVEGDAALGDRTVEVLDRAEVLVGERLVEHRPEAFGRLQLGAVGRQVDEPDALGDGQPGLRVPAGVVEDEDDDPVATGAGFAGEEGEERLEGRLRHPVRQVPEDLARGRLHEGGHVEPLEAVVAGRARSLALGRPDAAEDRLQPDAVLVGGEDFDDLARMLLRLFGEDGGELFLNASCSSAVARAGCSGRGTCTDHPSARSASQPRWTATEASPSSSAIHAATLRLVHSPPSAGGPASRSRSRSSSSGVRIVGLSPLPRRRSPSASGPPALYRARSFSTHRTPNAVVAATSATSWPFASSQIAWTCRAERASAAARNRSPSSATLKCPATSATCPPPASQGPAYRLRHPAGTVTEHISRKPYQTAEAAVAEARLVARIREICAEFPRYGY